MLGMHVYADSRLGAVTASRRINASALVRPPSQVAPSHATRFVHAPRLVGLIGGSRIRPIPIAASLRTVGA